MSRRLNLLAALCVLMLGWAGLSCLNMSTPEESPAVREVQSARAHVKAAFDKINDPHAY